MNSAVENLETLGDIIESVCVNMSEQINWYGPLSRKKDEGVPA